MSARHRNLSGELTAPPVEPVRPGRSRRAPRPTETAASRGNSTPPVQRRSATSRLTTDPRGGATSRGTATYRGTTDPRGMTNPRGMTDPRGTATSRGLTTPRGIGVLRGAPRTPVPGSRSPLLLRVTLATALLAAVGTSMMRAHVDVGAVAGDALRLMPVTHSSSAGKQQVVHLVPAGSQPAHPAASASGSRAAAAPALSLIHI